MSRQSRSRAFLAQSAGVARAIANEHRLELLEVLAEAPHSVESLSQRTEISFANVSQHLQTLKKAGLVFGRRDGKSVIYHLSDGPVVPALDALRNLTAHNVAAMQCVVDDYFEDIRSLHSIGAEEVAELLKSDSVTLLDVRPAQEFKTEHLQAARNISLEELESRLLELPPGKEIVAYCRGPYCVLSVRAVQMLERRGYNVRKLRQGFPEWKAAGLILEAGDMA